MRLSKEAIQADIEKAQEALVTQERAKQAYVAEIAALQTEQDSLSLMIQIIESGEAPEEWPAYDTDALAANIDRIDENIVLFEDQISALQDKQEEYVRIIATLEVKRDTEGF